MASTILAVLEETLEQINAPEALGADLTEAHYLDVIQAAERAKSAITALQVRATAKVAKLRDAAEKARGIPKSRRCKGLAGEIALARGHAPARGTQHLAVATALAHHMPETLKALAAGRIQEEHVQAATKETEWLSPRNRRAVDQLISKDFDGVGPRKLANIVREQAQRLDPKSAAKRLADAQTKRRVEVRPADNNMAQLRAILPLQQAVAVEQSLTEAAKSQLSTGTSSSPDGEKRTRDQLMADLLVERVTGQASAQAVPTQIHLVMTDDALFGDGDTPAWVSGHGPIPAAAARMWLTNPDMQVFLRRVFTSPKDHQLVALESKARIFPTGLRLMLLLRDDTCSVAYCEAAIQDADHGDPAREGGATSFDNGAGVCGGCNQRKENTGWRHISETNALTVATPTGHKYSRPKRGMRPRDALSCNDDSDTSREDVSEKDALSEPPRVSDSVQKNHQEQ